METTADTAKRSVEAYLRSDFPWYGLDEAFTGPRRLLAVGAGADRVMDHGAVGNGDDTSLKVGNDPAAGRFAVVVTVARRPLRHSTDNTGALEATSASSGAWLAGAGLLSCTRQTRIERSLRQDWQDQQTALAWELADDLDGPEWSTLTVPVDGVPVPFRYRESEYGWVMAGSAREVHLGVYGRGMSAYGLGLRVIQDITVYE